jgi:UDP-N-acetylglucosamine--N-acetylmuramyl-(pentapeptide) pyrophosphoryl-undecaprenol N-acetylglucosamine transferase
VADEQAGNANFLVRHEAGIALAQLETTPESLAALLASLNRENLAAMATKARALGRPDATARCADLCEALAS